MAIVKISVIIPNWNGRRFLSDCFESLREQTFRDFEIILVDNGSTDGSVEFVLTEYPGVKVVSLPSNQGFCAANNSGIKQARGEYIALLNNDTCVDSRWLQELAAVLESDPQIGFCASKILFFDRHDTLDAAGDEFFTWGAGGKRGHLRRDDEEFSVSRLVFGACAAAAIYRRVIFEDVGLLEESFFAYNEDVDLSFRAQLRGYRCCYVPSAVIYHRVQATARRLADRPVYLVRRNALAVLVRNMPASLLRKYFFLIFWYYFTGDLRLMLKGKGWVVLKARWHNLKSAPFLLRSRKIIQTGRVVSEDYLERLFEKRRWIDRFKESLF